MKKIIYRILLIIFSTVFIISASMIIKSYYDGYKSAKEFSQITELIRTPEIKKSEQAEQIEQTDLTAAEKYADLYTRNNDFIGWIKIDGTNIDYPIMQASDRKDYYLRRNFDKEYSYYGTPYIAEDCIIGESDNIVIYGHNMKNGTMFSAIEKYFSKNFYNEHQNINFDTLDGYGVYQIVSVFKTTDDDEFKYHRFTKAASENEFDQFIQNCKKRALYDTGVTAQYGDKLITISTCEYSAENGRLVVVAKKI